MDSFEVDSGAIYLGFQSVNYAKKTMSTVSNMMSASNIDYGLIKELGFDKNKIVNDFGNAYSKLMEFYSQLVKTKNLLLKTDPNNEYLFKQIDLQFKGMDLGDEPSETDYASYLDSLKEVYHIAKNKESYELNEFEQSVINMYESMGLDKFDSYTELLAELDKLKQESEKLCKNDRVGAGIGGYTIHINDSATEIEKQIAELTKKKLELEKILKEKGLLELNGLDEIKIAAEKFVEEAKELGSNVTNGDFESAGENLKTMLSTGAVVVEKVYAGAAKVVEYINDGTAMLVTLTATSNAIVVDAIFGTNYSDKMWEATMDYVSIDQVGAVEKMFYEGTDLGKKINDNSLLKYDSKGAELIKNVSVKAVEMAAAAIITIATGGTAAPLVAAGVGFLEGFGKGGEDRFSLTDENGNYTNREVKDWLLAGLDGVQKASDWYISGQTISAVYGGLNAFLNPTKIGTEALKNVTGNSFKDGIINTIKSPDIYIDLLAAASKTGAGYITNGEIDWKTFALDMGFAILGNFGGEYLSAVGANKAYQNLKSAEFDKLAANIDKQILDANELAKSGEKIDIKLKNLDDLSYHDLENINDRGLVKFDVKNQDKPLTWEEAFIQLKREGKIPNDSKLMTEYKGKIDSAIWYADYRATNHDNFSQVSIDSLDDLTVDNLGIVNAKNRDLISFKTADGNTLTWEEAFIQLKREGKIPDDSKLMTEYKDKIDSAIWYADYRATHHDNFSQVSIDRLDDLTVDHLGIVNAKNRDLISFRTADGNVVTWEEAFIQLKREGKIPDDSKLMTEYKDKITKIKEISTKTEKSLKKEILSSIKQDYSEIQIMRKIYIELNKRTNYDVDAILGDAATQNAIIDKFTTFDNLNNNNVVCKSWSELYAEALVEAGIDSSRVKVVKANNAKHWWVEIDMGNSIIRADATDAFLGSTDLANCKFGDSTTGFLILNKADSGFRVTNDTLKAHPEVLKSSNDYFRGVDKSIGYVKDDKYFTENITKLKKLFSNTSSPYDDIIKQNDILEKNVHSFMNMDIPKNMNGYDAFAYYRKFSNTLFNGSGNAIPSLKKINIEGKYYSATVVEMFDGKNKFYITFDEINGKKIYTNEEYINGPSKIYEDFKKRG